MVDTHKIRALLDARDAIDLELAALFNGNGKERKKQACGTCGQEGHSARTCDKKDMIK